MCFVFIIEPCASYFLLCWLVLLYLKILPGLCLLLFLIDLLWYPAVREQFFLYPLGVTSPASSLGDLLKPTNHGKAKQSRADRMSMANLRNSFVLFLVFPPAHVCLQYNPSIWFDYLSTLWSGLDVHWVEKKKTTVEVCFVNCKSWTLSMCLFSLLQQSLSSGNFFYIMNPGNACHNRALILIKPL